MMLHTKYQGSRPYGFRQEDFLLFSSRKTIFSLGDLDMHGPELFEQLLKRAT